MKINQVFSQQLTMAIGMMLNPRMIQMLKILNMPYVELVEKINEEAENNPVIEIDKKDSLIEYLRYSSSSPYKKAFDDSDNPAHENMLSKCASLEDILISQIDLIEMQEIEKKICVNLIQNMDSNGYINDYEKIRNEISLSFCVEGDLVDECLKTVQSLEPEGIGARNLKECLKIQVDEYRFENKILEKLIKKTIDNHLENIMEENFEIIANDLKIEKEGVKEIINFIKSNLNPYPGSKFGGKSSPAIPSFQLSIEENGALKLTNLEEKYGPQIKFNNQYIKMLDNPNTDEKTVRYLQEKVKAAKTLLENLEKRHKTIGKIIDEVIKRQKDFLTGASGLPKPLSQKELSDLFGIHPSTTSRAISEKYIETPEGIIKLKSLCPRKSGGFTRAYVHNAIKDIIKEETGKKPLTDQEIMETLKERNINLKRRTVSSYRKSIEIKPSKERAERKKQK